MLVLGIETSCDETAVGLVENGRLLRSSVLASSVEEHARWGGVVPELAARQHVLSLRPVLADALRAAGARPGDIDLVAVTHEPGLLGSLVCGAAFARGLAAGLRRPLLPIHHLEGHVYANWLDEAGPPPFPLLALIVSGGHSDLALVREPGHYERLGGTVDDAAGEAFDKVGRLLGLGFPGGPAIEAAARDGDPAAFRVPRARPAGRYDLSFSGVKTHMQRLVQEQGRAGDGSLEPGRVADLAASFQAAVVGVLVDRAVAAAEATGARSIVLSGGVAANRSLVAALRVAADPLPVWAPPPALCTDNGAMIAAAGWHRWQAGERPGQAFDVAALAPLGR